MSFAGTRERARGNGPDFGPEVGRATLEGMGKGDPCSAFVNRLVLWDQVRGMVGIGCGLHALRGALFLTHTALVLDLADRAEDDIVRQARERYRQAVDRGSPTALAFLLARDRCLVALRPRPESWRRRRGAWDGGCCW